MHAEQKRMVSKVAHHATHLTWVSRILRLLSAQEQIWDLFSQLHENLDFGPQSSNTSTIAELYSYG